MYTCMYLCLQVYSFFVFLNSHMRVCTCSVVGVETCMPTGIEAKVEFNFSCSPLFDVLFSLSSWG